MSNTVFGMSQETKAKLLASMRQKKEAPLSTRSLSPEISAEFTDFAKLPIYTQLKVQRAVAKRLDLEDPYYVMHDGCSQAKAVIDGEEYDNFSCYDYLGLNHDPRILAVATETMQKYGYSASASRLTAGERPPHRSLEKSIASLYGTEDALVFVSGHATNVSTLECLFGPQDGIFYDVRSHNSLVLGASASGAKRYCFPNNDMEALRSLLQAHRSTVQRAIIVTEGLFGMDGCICALPELIQLKKEFGTFLMVDEAHSMGILGARGFGVHEHYQVSALDVDIWMGTLSKCFCGCGGYIAGTSVLMDILKYNAPGYVYSVGMPPVMAAISNAAIDLMVKEPFRVQKLQANSQRMLALAQEAHLDTGKAEGYAVIPIMVGDSLSCVLLSHLLRKEHILALPIIYPGVEEGKARLRFFISQTHTEEQLARAIAMTGKLLPLARERALAFAG